MAATPGRSALAAPQSQFPKRHGYEISFRGTPLRIELTHVFGIQSQAMRTKGNRQLSCCPSRCRVQISNDKAHYFTHLSTGRWIE